MLAGVSPTESLMSEPDTSAVTTQKQQHEVVVAVPDECSKQQQDEPKNYATHQRKMDPTRYPSPPRTESPEKYASPMKSPRRNPRRTASDVSNRFKHLRPSGRAPIQMMKEGEPDSKYLVATAHRNAAARNNNAAADLSRNSVRRTLSEDSCMKTVFPDVFDTPVPTTSSKGDAAAQMRHTRRPKQDGAALMSPEEHPEDWQKESGFFTSKMSNSASKEKQLRRSSCGTVGINDLPWASDKSGNSNNNNSSKYTGVFVTDAVKDRFRRRATLMTSISNLQWENETNDVFNDQAAAAAATDGNDLFNDVAAAPVSNAAAKEKNRRRSSLDTSVSDLNWEPEASSFPIGSATVVKDKSRRRSSLDSSLNDLNWEPEGSAFPIANSAPGGNVAKDKSQRRSSLDSSLSDFKWEPEASAFPISNDSTKDKDGRRSSPSMASSNDASWGNGSDDKTDLFNEIAVKAARRASVNLVPTTAGSDKKSDLFNEIANRAARRASVDLGSTTTKSPSATTAPTRNSLDIPKRRASNNGFEVCMVPAVSSSNAPTQRRSRRNSVGACGTSASDWRAVGHKSMSDMDFFFDDGPWEDQQFPTGSTHSTDAALSEMNKTKGGKRRPSLGDFAAMEPDQQPPESSASPDRDSAAKQVDKAEGQPGVANSSTPNENAKQKDPERFSVPPPPSDPAPSENQPDKSSVYIASSPNAQQRQRRAASIRASPAVTRSKSSEDLSPRMQRARANDPQRFRSPAGPCPPAPPGNSPAEGCAANQPRQRRAASIRSPGVTRSKSSEELSPRLQKPNESELLRTSPTAPPPPPSPGDQPDRGSAEMAAPTSSQARQRRAASIRASPAVTRSKSAEDLPYNADNSQLRRGVKSNVSDTPRTTRPAAASVIHESHGPERERPTLDMLDRSPDKSPRKPCRSMASSVSVSTGPRNRPRRRTSVDTGGPGRESPTDGNLTKSPNGRGADSNEAKERQEASLQMLRRHTRRASLSMNAAACPTPRDKHRRRSSLDMAASANQAPRNKEPLKPSLVIPASPRDLPKPKLRLRSSSPQKYPLIKRKPGSAATPPPPPSSSPPAEEEDPRVVRLDLLGKNELLAHLPFSTTGKADSEMPSFDAPPFSFDGDDWGESKEHPNRATEPEKKNLLSGHLSSHSSTSKGVYKPGSDERSSQTPATEITGDGCEWELSSRDSSDVGTVGGRSTRSASRTPRSRVQHVASNNSMPRSQSVDSFAAMDQDFGTTRPPFITKY